MKVHETMMHILYAKQSKEDGIIEPDRHMNIDYAGVIEDLIKMGLVKRDNGINLRFTELGKEKISYLREVRGLTE